MTEERHRIAARGWIRTGDQQGTEVAVGPRAKWLEDSLSALLARTESEAVAKAEAQVAALRDALRRTHIRLAGSNVLIHDSPDGELAREVLNDLSAALADTAAAVRPRIVCLCGSTRFFESFQEASLQETVAGKIVLSIGCNLRSDNQLWADPAERDAIKARLDELHLRKIDLADEVFVLNVDGYIGESTRREIDYAASYGKPVRYLEPPGAPLPSCGTT